MFIRESIEVKMCFISILDTSNIKSMTINYFEHRVHNIQLSLHRPNGYGLVSFTFNGNLCRLLFIIYCVLERFKADSSAILRTDFLWVFLTIPETVATLLGIITGSLPKLSVLWNLLKISWEDSHRRRALSNIKSFMKSASCYRWTIL